MCRVVDGGNRKADEQVNDDDGEHANPDSSLKEWRYRTSVPNSKNEQNTEQTENGARCTRGDRLRMVEIAAVYTRDTGQHIKYDKPRWTIELFNLWTNNPKRIGIEKEMEHSDMDKYWSDEAPPFSTRYFRICLYTKRQKRRFAAAAACRGHQHEDQ